MNINPSQCSRVVSSFFFVFILLFSCITQAGILQKMIRNLSDVPQSQKEKVFEIYENLNAKPKDLSENEMRTLARALDDPISLIENSPDGPFGPEFPDRVFPRRHLLHRGFFFALFDLHRDSDALFTKLFSRKKWSKWEELPFREAKRNWENFLGSVEQANRFGYTQIRETDLEAAAISFVHQKFSNKYLLSDEYVPNDRYASPLIDLPRSFISTSPWEERSLGTFFHRRFTIDHYTNPHFTLTPENSYHYFIMKMISDFLDRGVLSSASMSVIDSKEFILRIWKDITQEFSGQGNPGMASSVFSQRIIDSIIECRTLGFSTDDQPFMSAMAEAAREDDRLAQLFKIVDKFASRSFASTSDLENYRQNALQQFREMSDSERDPIIFYNFLLTSFLPR